MCDDRLLANGIDGELDPVPSATGVQIDDALVAVQDEGHGYQGLERVALGAAFGCVICIDILVFLCSLY